MFKGKEEWRQSNYKIEENQLHMKYYLRIIMSPVSKPPSSPSSSWLRERESHQIRFDSVIVLEMIVKYLFVPSLAHSVPNFIFNFPFRFGYVCPSFLRIIVMYPIVSTFFVSNVEKETGKLIANLESTNRVEDIDLLKRENKRYTLEQK